ncbi:sensor histidine kinase [Paludisphaera rhizosphaerae]|uniref:sensor histidine kinase n=1 Tax=Paludisphaera rhizosphaerae TaxID=2711216 RepID=UPI001F0E0165|nr:ATP-binding protein [Paludisphaera rhizosphaerae]
MSRMTRSKPQVEPEAIDAETAIQQIEALRRQVTALQRISSLGLLAGGVFHELNNALTPIVSYAKLGLRNPDSAYRERALKKIQEAADRATTITGSMLGLSRPGRDPNHREPVDLGRLVDDVVMLTCKDLNKHNVRLDVLTPSRPFARVNAIQIQQVLINLLINARQSMPEGGLVTLRLATDTTGRMAEVSVVDQGVGIAPENLRRIFEPFFSTKNGPDDVGQGGTGLGLAVCRDIIEAHHGRIRAESRRGKGSTFTLLLPSCPPPAAAEPRVGAA